MDAFLTHGAHYLALADWGCDDGVHSAWLTVEAEDRADAIGMLFPASRAGAVVVMLKKYLPEEVRDLAARIKAGTAHPEGL